MTESVSPVYSLTAIAALTAACVAFISFLFNYRSTIRSQRDNQFYEAMKRFGDKDSPAIRSSAAGLLGQFATTYPRVYLNTAFQQLLAGLFLETNRVVLRSVVDAIIQIIPQQPRRAANRLADLNKLAYAEFISALMEIVADEADNISVTSPRSSLMYSLSTTNFTQLEILSGFSETTLRVVLDDYTRLETLKRILLLDLPYASWAMDIPGGSMVAGRKYRVQDTAERIRTISALLDKAITLGYTPWARALCASTRSSLDAKSELFWAEHHFYQARWCGFDFSNTNFVGAHLELACLEHLEISGSDMSRASMGRTQFVGVRFVNVNLEGGELLDASFSRVVMSNVNLKDTKMWGLQLGHKCDLSEANWWEADFFYPQKKYYYWGKGGTDGDIDCALLTKLFSSHPPRLASDHAYGGHGRQKRHFPRIHPSVRRFIESAESSIREEPRWVTELCKASVNGPGGA